MMRVHPLFAGFAGASIDRVGRALGFELLAEVRPGALPSSLPLIERGRLSARGDLAGYRFAGGWAADGQHCLLFAKPVTETAERFWSAGLERPGNPLR